VTAKIALFHFAQLRGVSPHWTSLIALSASFPPLLVLISPLTATGLNQSFCFPDTAQEIALSESPPDTRRRLRISGRLDLCFNLDSALEARGLSRVLSHELISSPVRHLSLPLTHHAGALALLFAAYRTSQIAHQ
jgi:hypothetical protein